MSFRKFPIISIIRLVATIFIACLVIPLGVFASGYEIYCLNVDIENLSDTEEVYVLNPVSSDTDKGDDEIYLVNDCKYVAELPSNGSKKHFTLTDYSEFGKDGKLLMIQDGAEKGVIIDFSSVKFSTIEEGIYEANVSLNRASFPSEQIQSGDIPLTSHSVTTIQLPYIPPFVLVLIFAVIVVAVVSIIANVVEKRRRARQRVHSSTSPEGD